MIGNEARQVIDQAHAIQRTPEGFRLENVALGPPDLKAIQRRRVFSGFWQCPDRMASGEQFSDEDTADVARCPGDQNHRYPLSPRPHRLRPRA